MSNAKAAARWYRRDITGLRSIAIVPVVAFHAGAQFIPGGFIGVDVFYVISGFLITTLLVREAESLGRIKLGVFWAKRIRRLAPALFVVTVFSLVVGAAVSSVLSWDELARQGIASILYVANILFWRDSTSYFDTGSAVSPFLHMWSLGVEEQFYVVWPLLIVASVSMAARRFPLRRVLLVTFALVFVFSFGLSVLLTPRDPDAAFYLLPTRAWEFAGAGLLALVPAERLPRGRVFASVSGFAGLLILLFGFTSITEFDAYPGFLALVPFIATILLIFGGANSLSLLAPVFESRVAVWIGEVSYSWYLWHWPLIVFAAALFPGSIYATASAGVVSLAAGALSFYYIERPARFASFWNSSTRRTFAVGAVSTVAVAAVGAGVFISGSVLLRTEPLRSYAVAAETLPSKDCGDGTTETVDSMPICVLGDPNGAKTVAFIGDSHAGHWRDAMSEAARQNGFRLIVRWKSSCPSLDVRVVDDRGTEDRSCPMYRHRTNDIINALRPDLVVISNSYGYDDKITNDVGQRIDGDRLSPIWAAALKGQIDDVRNAGARVALIEDNPRLPFNPTACLSRLGASPEDCDAPLADALAPGRALAAGTQSAIEEEAIADEFPVVRRICGSARCTAVDAMGRPIFQDRSHLAREWTLQFVPDLRRWLDDAVSR